MELRVSLDEREDPDEEQEIEVEGIPFVVNEDVIDSYGLKYTIAVDEHNMPAATPCSWTPPSAATSSTA